MQPSTEPTAEALATMISSALALAYTHASPNTRMELAQRLRDAGTSVRPTNPSLAGALRRVAAAL